MKDRVVRVVFAAAVVAVGCGSAWADVPASAYVQNGLVALFDGIDNVGTGTHDSNATAWKSLVSAHEIAISDGYANWSDNGFELPSEKYSTIATCERIVLGDYVSCEACYDETSRTSAVPYLFGVSTRQSFIYASMGVSVANSAKFYKVPMADDAVPTGFHSLYGDYGTLTSTTPTGCGFDGVLLTDRVDKTDNWQTRSYFTIGYTSNSNWPFWGRFHAFRFYNRTLTADEVAWNAMIDRCRFQGAALDSSMSLPDRKIIDGAVCVPVRVTANADCGTATLADGGTDAWMPLSDDTVEITATANDGWAFFRWTGDVADLSSSERTSATVAVRIDRPRTLNAEFVRAGAFGATSYSPNGLVFQLDGIENAGYGSHDGAAATWIDLVGGVAVPIGVGDVVGEDCVQFSAERKFSGVAGLTEPGTITVEVCRRASELYSYDGGQRSDFWLKGRVTTGNYTEANSGGVSTFLSYPEGSGFGRECRAKVQDGNLRTVITNAPHTYAAVVSMGSATAAFDGAEKPVLTPLLQTVTASQPDGSGGIGNSTFKPCIYAVRVYNRALTADEIARHALIDRVRFLGDSPDFKLEDGVEKFRVTVVQPDGVSTVSWQEKGTTATASCAVPVGQSFRLWRGAPEGTDRTANPLEFEVTGPVTLTAQLVDPQRLTADSYVKDGLIAFWDARANAGIDADGNDVHDGNAAIWKDLSGNGQDAHAKKDVYLSWSDDAACQNGVTGGAYNGGYFAFTGAEPLMTAANDMHGNTVQICYWKDNTGSGTVSGYVCGWAYFGFYTTDNGNSMLWRFRGVQPSVGGAAITQGTSMTASFDGSSLDRWFGTTTENVYVPAVASMADQPVPAADSGELFSSFYQVRSKLHSVRYYNRVLTDYERMLNVRIDEERYLGAEPTRIFAVESTGLKAGTAEGYDYGAYRVEPGTEVSSSFAASLHTFEDGISGLEISDVERQAIVGYTVAPRTSEPVFHEGEASASLTVDDDVRLIWNWAHQYRLNYAASAGGTIACAKPSGSFFSADGGATVRLVAQPDDDHKFAGWTGDTVGVADPSSAEIDVPVDRGRNLTAVFAEKHHTPVELSWQGGETGRWNDPANWGGVLPQDGDTVTIAREEGVTVTLDSATPELGTLIVRGTLNVAGWDYAVRADEVLVEDGGVITCAGGFGSMSDVSNRVWIVCRDLTVAAGGRIDVSGKGWTAAAAELGAGPGAGGAVGAGGAYGGFAGAAYVSAIEDIPMGTTYGNVEDPRDPGSAGSASGITATGSVGGAGGGAVLIQASGAVTVGGSIVADGGDSSGTGYRGGGSGGGISVFCRTIGGTGTLAARGGWGGDRAGRTPGHNGFGGGGRIAVHYDTAAQAACETQPSLTFDTWHSGWTGSTYEGNHVAGEAGTLWLPDAQLLKETFNASAQVYLPGAKLSLASLTVPGGRQVQFPQDGFELDVAGDVTLSGSYSMLAFGGAQLVHRAVFASVVGFRRFGDQQPVKVRIGGNLLVTGKSCDVVLRAAKMSVADADPEDGVPCGGTLEVGGRILIGSSDRLVTVSHYWTGVSPLILTHGLTVEEGGKLTADAQGHFAGNPYAALPLEGQNGSYGFGPGASTKDGTGYSGPGGSHFGLGGRGGTTISSDFLYDDSKNPHMPGSGASHSWSDGTSGSGGGVVYVIASGRVIIRGTVSAVGTMNCTGHAAGCAGGSICLKARRLVITETGRITAKGGDAQGDGGMGGGGGVALYRAFDGTGSVITSESTAESVVESGIVSVAHGTTTSTTTIQSPTDGKVYLGQLPKPGLRILVR